MTFEVPECEFLGIDIAPLPPTTILPPNCSFERVNVLEGIPKPDNYFDYVYQRLMVTAIPADKWEQHIQECVRVCASGGWVEIAETNGLIVDGGSACQQFNTWFTEGHKMRGIDVNKVQNLEELLRKAGLANVTKQTVTVPIGLWGKKVGVLFVENHKRATGHFQPLFTNALGVPKEEVENNCALVLKELESHQAYAKAYVYLGQKQ
jgi:hypothetical protein